jgi:hypothetical protein
MRVLFRVAHHRLDKKSLLEQALAQLSLSVSTLGYILVFCYLPMMKDVQLCCLTCLLYLPLISRATIHNQYFLTKFC